MCRQRKYSSWTVELITPLLNGYERRRRSSHERYSRMQTLLKRTRKFEIELHPQCSVSLAALDSNERDSIALLWACWRRVRSLAPLDCACSEHNCRPILATLHTIVHPMIQDSIDDFEKSDQCVSFCCLNQLRPLVYTAAHLHPVNHVSYSTCSQALSAVHVMLRAVYHGETRRASRPPSARPRDSVFCSKHNTQAGNSNPTTLLSARRLNREHF